jgi:hypothetical protein
MLARRVTWRVTTPATPPQVTVSDRSSGFLHVIAADSRSSEAWQPAYRAGVSERIRIIPPHAEWFTEIPAGIKDKIYTCDDNTYVVRIEFTDAAGKRWE